MAKKPSSKFPRNAALAAVTAGVGLAAGFGLLPGLAAAAAAYGYEALDDRAARPRRRRRSRGERRR